MHFRTVKDSLYRATYNWSSLVAAAKLRNLGTVATEYVEDLSQQEAWGLKYN